MGILTVIVFSIFLLVVMILILDIGFGDSKHNKEYTDYLKKNCKRPYTFNMRNLSYYLLTKAVLAETQIRFSQGEYTYQSDDLELVSKTLLDVQESDQHPDVKIKLSKPEGFESFDAVKIEIHIQANQKMLASELFDIDQITNIQTSAILNQGNLVSLQGWSGSSETGAFDRLIQHSMIDIDLFKEYESSDKAIEAEISSDQYKSLAGENPTSFNHRNLEKGYGMVASNNEMLSNRPDSDKSVTTEQNQPSSSSGNDLATGFLLGKMF